MGLSIGNIAQLGLFAVLLASGQILFKVASTTSPALTSPADVLFLFKNIWFWLALVLYGTATLLWIVILQQIHLSMAYPFVALGFIIVPLASWALFKEPLNISYVAGVALIIAGLGVITTMAPR